MPCVCASTSPPTCSLKAASAKGPTSSLRRFQPRSPPLRAASSEYAVATCAHSKGAQQCQQPGRRPCAQHRRNMLLQPACAASEHSNVSSQVTALARSILGIRCCNLRTQQKKAAVSAARPPPLRATSSETAVATCVCSTIRGTGFDRGMSDRPQPCARHLLNVPSPWACIAKESCWCFRGHKESKILCSCCTVTLL